MNKIINNLWGRIILGVTAILVIVVVVVIVMNRGGEGTEVEDTPQPALTSVFPQPSLPPGIALMPTQSTPDPTNTPFVMPEEDLFEEAAARASADLSGRLNISITLIKVLPPDTPIAHPGEMLCPQVEMENVSIYYLYLQYERFIYPYQFYRLPEEGAELAVEACESTLVDTEVLYVPTPDSRPDILQKVEADLQSQGVDPNSGEYQVTRMTWTNEALGCPNDREGQATPALIEGYLVKYTLNHATYEYHTDQTGERVVQCKPPIGYASTEAFIFTLEKDQPFEVKRSDEVIRYEGLDKDGTLILLTPYEQRVGVFDFDTPEAARLAATQINDDRVSQIFVSGYVLIVEEEFTPEIYTTLLMYAENVRSPITERAEPATIPTEIATEVPAS